MISIVVVLFAFPPAGYKGSCFVTSSPVFAVNTLDYGYSKWGEMTCKCCFDFPFVYSQGN
jgi:hypothetical protein